MLFSSFKGLSFSLLNFQALSMPSASRFLRVNYSLAKTCINEKNFTYVADDICVPTARIWHIYELRFYLLADTQVFWVVYWHMLIWIRKENSAKLQFYLLILKLTAFSFPLPPSFSWCLSPTKTFSPFHTEFRDLSSHFHHHGTLFFTPMRATLHSAPCSRLNFWTTRTLKWPIVGNFAFVKLRMYDHAASRCEQRGCQSFHWFSSVKP